MYVCMCICMCMCVCLYVCMSVCLYVCMYECMYVFMYSCMYIYIYLNICICMCIYIYMCVVNVIQWFMNFMKSILHKSFQFTEPYFRRTKNDSPWPENWWLLRRKSPVLLVEPPHSVAHAMLSPNFAGSISTTVTHIFPEKMFKKKNCNSWVTWRNSPWLLLPNKSPHGFVWNRITIYRFRLIIKM